MEASFNLPQNIDKWLKYLTFIKSASPLTLKHYQIDLRQTFEYENLSDIKKVLWTEAELLSAVRAAFNRWAELSLASRNRKAATLKSFFSWAFDEGQTARDLSIQVICPRVPRKLPHFVSVDEALAVLNTLTQEQNKYLKEKILFLLLYGGGLRVSEACALKWEQIQFQRNTLRLIGKGSKERIVAVPGLVISSLSSWRKSSSETEYVFGNSALNPRTAYEMIRQSGQRAGLLKPLHPHALRHSFATHLLTSGANLRTLQELLGHESLQATEKYTHLGIDHLARTMEKMHPLGKVKS